MGDPDRRPWNIYCTYVRYHTYKTLADLLVHLGSCPHRLHLPCYAALHVSVSVLSDVPGDPLTVE